VTDALVLPPGADAQATVAFLRAALGARLVQVAARCAIDYQGRAESKLPLGARLLLFKPDGTLVVHTSTKLKPVNWQPPGCIFAADLAGGRVVLTATRERPKETVRIELESVQFAAALDLDDGDGFALEGSEDDLQAFLAKQPDLIEPGFRFWARERASGRGPMDLYGEDARGRRVVVEVKRRAAGVAEADQLRRYVERERNAREGLYVRGILVAPGVSDKARKYLADLQLEYREVDWDKLRKTASTMLKAGQRRLGDW
jgi:RecB family endonuclease NucS